MIFSIISFTKIGVIMNQKLKNEVIKKFTYLPKDCVCSICVQIKEELKEKLGKSQYTFYCKQFNILV